MKKPSSTTKNATVSNKQYEMIINLLKSINLSYKLIDLQHTLLFIKHSDPTIRNIAISISSNIIKDNLINHFNDIDITIRKKLVTILEVINPLTINEIEKDLDSDDSIKKLRAIQILGLLKNKKCTRIILTKLIYDKDEKVRATVVNILSKVVDLRDDYNIILSFLNDEDKRVKANTIEAIESLGSKRLIPILLRFRHDSNNRIRGNVLKALYSLGYTDIEQDLIDMLNSNNFFMNASALWTISQTNFMTKNIQKIINLNNFNNDISNDNNTLKISMALK